MVVKGGDRLLSFNHIIYTHNKPMRQSQSTYILKEVESYLPPLYIYIYIVTILNMVVVAKKDRQEDISFNHYTVNSRQEILCEPRATYIL